MEQQSGGPRRVRRPKDKEELLDRLQQKDSPFSTLRDTLVFAAGVGWWRKRRAPFEKSGETIRWDALTARSGTEAFINMLALRHIDDVTVLSDERFDERIRVFEEYANGGLEVLGDLIDNSPKRVIDIVRDLVNRAGEQAGEKANRIGISDVDLSFVQHEND